MALKIIGWVLIAILFFALIAIIAAVCFIIPYFEDKNDDERLFDLSEIQAKSNKEDESELKKKKFIDNSTRPVTRLPPIILPHFPIENKTSTESTTTTKKTTPAMDYNIKNMSQSSTLPRKWHHINQTEPLYPQIIETGKYPVKQADTLDFGFEEKNTRRALTPTSTSTISKAVDQFDPLGLAEPTKIWLVPEEQKLMKKRESDD
ncbi:uncharacterized protein LOC123265261 [Cotesia glomerata]|uniref:uncharacterized protein LOC123265261 n=1 Tax=Cotesia glomerata TaxID=32391 RepID=UPI001D01B5B0|nr:uncharacterized protein LOC123265261 [Cotesia glomerata]